MKKIIIMVMVLTMSSVALAAPPKDGARTKFYNFDEMLIDGEIKKPTGLYINERKKVKFGRLLRLKKSFMKNLMDSAHDKVFK